MASQVIALQAPSGLSSPTLKVFPDGSDTQVSGSPFTLVEATNRKGHYEASFTGTLSGLHETVLFSGANPIGDGWVLMSNADGTYTVSGDRPQSAIATIDDATKEAIAIECAAAVVGSSVVVSPVSPISATDGDPLNVLRPDEYSSTTGQAIAFTVSGVPEPDSVYFDASVYGTNKLHVACDTSYSGSTLSITVPTLTADDLDLLPSGAIADFRFYGNYGSGPERTYRRGKVFVEDVASAPVISPP